MDTGNVTAQAMETKKLDIQLVRPPGMAEMEARVTRYPNREAWLEARRNGIGGSEAAIIMGASSWGSPYQLWQDKTGLVPPEEFDNEVLRFGRVVEPLIADEYEKVTGRKLVHLGDWAIRKHPSQPGMFATHDRLIEPIDDRGPGVLSIKSANTWKGIEWLEGEEPPLPYQVQFQHELACSGLKWGSFVVLIWGRGIRWMDAERNDAFINVLEEECAEFWRRVQTGDAPPIDGSEHTRAALNRLYPVDDGQVVELPAAAADWGAELETCEATLKEFEMRREQLRNMIRAAIGPATEGFVPGGPAWTFKTQRRRETVQAASEFRVLRRKASKKGQVAA